MTERVLLLVPARSYRAADFVLAATRMGVELVVASDGALALPGRPVIPVSSGDPDGSAERIMDRSGPVDAVVAADTQMLILAAMVASRMGPPHNPVHAVRAASDKASQRGSWAAAGVAQPAFEIVPARDPDDSICRAAEAAGLPCVVKAVSLSASQGVMRADDPAAAVLAARRIRQILAAASRTAEPLLIEEYLPGPELSIDGLLTEGNLRVAAIFDKPRTPDGPTFEETMLITPSRLPEPVLAQAVRTAERAARAIGLSTGPVHAELRIAAGSDGPVRPAMLELAARSIGGLCSRALRFPGGKSLEELVLANALGQAVEIAGRGPTGPPSGVYMLPVARAGVLRSVDGRDAAAAVPGITGLTITIPLGQRVLPLPAGDRYLGFIFAEGGSRYAVEKTLTAASQRLCVIIEDTD